MQLAFNIEVRENKEYLLSEEDSKKVMDTAYELARGRQYDIDDDPNLRSFYVEYATQLLLDSGEIEGVLFHESTEEELTSVWEQIE